MGKPEYQNLKMLRNTLKSTFITYSALKQLRLCSGAAKTIPIDVKGKITDYEISKDDFKWVERILPDFTVPEPPQHESYPTPSGWVPQKAEAGDLPYFVRRTRHYNMPIYMEQRNSRHLTHIRYVEGDVWQFEADLKEYLEKRLGQKVYTQVDELCTKVRVRGYHLEEVKDFFWRKASDSSSQLGLILSSLFNVFVC